MVTRKTTRQVGKCLLIGGCALFGLVVITEVITFVWAGLALRRGGNDFTAIDSLVPLNAFVLFPAFVISACCIPVGMYLFFTSRRHDGRCEQCGYLLSGGDGPCMATCPECGLVNEPD